MNQQSMQQPQQPGVAKWLWIVLIIVIIAGGAFFAWYYLMGPGKTTTEVATTTTTTTTTPTTTTTTPSTTTTTIGTTSTADWKKFTNTKLGISLKYPSKYSEPTVKDQAGDTGTEIFVTFSSPTAANTTADGVVGCSASSDFTASRGASKCELVKTFTYSAGKCNDMSCTEVKTMDGKSAYYAETTSGEGGTPVYIGFIPLTNSTYKVFSIEIGKTVTDALNTLKSMLGTVQFTN